MSTDNRKRYITYNGETHCTVEWANLLGVNVETLRGRLARDDWSDFKLYHGEKLPARPVRYIQDKIMMLTHHFYINLTPEERAHFHSLTTEVAVDQYAHDLILKKL